MGNRATVIFTDGKELSSAVYLHWNGGPESVYPFLDEFNRRKVRHDTEYAPARFAHVVCDFFDMDEVGGQSVGVSNGPTDLSPDNLAGFDPGDHGVYVVQWKDGGWFVRRFGRSDWNGPVREWPREQVEAEKEAAYRHKYNVGEDTIAGKFLALRPKISQYG